MTIKHMTLFLTMVLFLTFCNSCTNIPIFAGHDESDTDMEKMLVPHLLWTCGMQDGIPKPENGILVFKAQMNLEQVHDVYRGFST